ncbi:hypothetical protein HK105_208500 [Polyrhizophydium stewartii]|uniref:Uncharacterized protein n=1 Tax=Polyrhizophydium stewartii TaxID=2732419 RepID=A0ABR4MXL1_9FUNG
MSSISALGQQLLAQSLPPSEIEVLEIDEYVSADQKELLRLGSVVTVRKTLKDGEEAYNVYVIEGKKVGSMIGVIDRKSVIGNDLVAGQAYIVTNDLRNSEKLTDKRKSTKHKGMVKCTLISDIIEGGEAGAEKKKKK